jgi:inosine/xanthosine triphosphatase
MKIVNIASANPVKVKATREGFSRMFTKERFDFRMVKSTAVISSQPMSDEETLDGATRRAENIREQAPEGDYWVGIEGGISDWPIGMGAFAWVVVLSKDRIGRGRSGEFFLPENVADLVRQGVELGEADDRIFSRNNSKHGNGAIGLLTNDVVDRANLYIPAVIFALIPFLHPELYP